MIAGTLRGVQLLDRYGEPIRSERETALAQARAEVRREIARHRRQQLNASYDAAQTVTGNELHWRQADHLDPHSAASPTVRKVLRSRSRYEVIENNPFLKGTILTVANDFVGTGPKLQVTDRRLSPQVRRTIEERWEEWATARHLRRKLWRSRIAKIVDGETFWRVYDNTKTRYPIGLDFQVIETDRVGGQLSSGLQTYGLTENNEIDGVRFDGYENPTAYHVLRVHPGLGVSFSTKNLSYGDWIKERFVVHWYRQDRGWLRGIPETTPSLPLCSVLRRYTLAVLRHSETAADLTAIIESEGPPNVTLWNNSDGSLIEDDPFATFPIEAGMITNLPWGYTMKQLSAVPLGVQYDEYVGSLLREITRPLLVPFHMTAGTSKDSNMASAVVDVNIYKGGQKAERIDCNDFVLDKVLDLWWSFARNTPGYIGDVPGQFSPFRNEIPRHRWRWDAIGLEHTDPQKVAKALETLHTKRFATDRDIQEGHFNRSLEDWQDEVKADDEFRKGLADFGPAPGQPTPAGKSNDSGDDGDGDE